MLNIKSGQLENTLWHGTSEPADKIRQEGLTSLPIFLTDNPQLAIEYAQSDQDRTGYPFVTLVNIQVENLDESKLGIDPNCWDAWIDNGDGGYNKPVETWQESLKQSDQCTYHSVIPPSIITVEDYSRRE